MTEHSIRARSIGQRQADALTGHKREPEPEVDEPRESRSALERRAAALEAELARRETIGQRQARAILGKGIGDA